MTHLGATAIQVNITIPAFHQRVWYEKQPLATTFFIRYHLVL